MRGNPDDLANQDLAEKKKLTRNEIRALVAHKICCVYLIEMLINLLIVSAITISMFTMFNHVNYTLNITKNKNEVIHFSNEANMVHVVYKINHENDE